MGPWRLEVALPGQVGAEGGELALALEADSGAQGELHGFSLGGRRCQGGVAGSGGGAGSAARPAVSAGGAFQP